MERMMVAWGLSSPPVLLDLDGRLLHDEFDLDPGWFVENLEDQFLDLGLAGILVWEGDPIVGTPEEHEEFGTCDLSVGAWRPPTDGEWVALRGFRSPFNSEQTALGSLVE